MSKKLKQIPLNLSREMPGFSRYIFYPDGTVKDTKTGKPCPREKISAKVFAFKLTGDDGKRKRVYPAQIAELFKEPEVKGRATYDAGKKTYNRLSDMDIDCIKKCKDDHKRGLGAHLARRYNVSESTISRIWSEQTRTKKAS